MIEVERDRQNDFVARLRDGEDGVDERHVGARRHHDAAAARDVDAVFVAKLRREALDERRQPLAALIFVRSRVGQRRAGGVDGRLRRAVVDHPLAERNRARNLADDIADDRHNRRLNRVHTRQRAQHLVHGCEEWEGWPILPAMARRRTILSLVLSGAIISALIGSDRVAATGSLRSPREVLGFNVGADNRLAGWDSIVDYMKLAAAGSERVRYREIGKTSGGNPFIVLEISAPDTLKNLDRYKQMERKLYFQDGAPSDGERDEIFRQGKLVLLVTCSIHATEIGASQMSLELVHRLATDDSPAVKKILDNVIFLLVPSLNPDGQIMVTDWFNKNLGTPYETSPLPYLYHPYAGHDNNRDMYMFTQKESQYTAQLLWHDWFPAVWLDEHQMGSNAARIFVMPAADPINPNVHPLIYRWNAILGQSQAAALEAAGKEGIIYNSTYTNFWEGAMAWSGWWHNQIGLLTEVASARVAAPIDQQSAVPVRPGAAGGGASPRIVEGSNASIPPPTDINPRTEYPRPWLGGHWTLRDIVDYELIATMALLETAADRRETIMRQIYEVNRLTIENGKKASPSAILVPVEGQHDAREAVHLVDRLRVGGVDVYRADASFLADGGNTAPARS